MKTCLTSFLHDPLVTSNEETFSIIILIILKHFLEKKLIIHRYICCKFKSTTIPQCVTDYKKVRFAYHILECKFDTMHDFK